MQDLHGDARGLVCTVPAAAGPEIASINAPPGVEWGTCLSLQVGDIRTLMLIDTSGLWIQYGRPSGWTDWIHIATATPPQEYDLPLAEGWTSQISGSCRYAKSQENIVFVTFKVVHDEATPASTDTMIATLPEGFWPSALVHSVCIRSDFVSSGIAVFVPRPAAYGYVRHKRFHPGLALLAKSYLWLPVNPQRRTGQNRLPFVRLKCLEKP